MVIEIVLVRAQLEPLKFKLLGFQLLVISYRCSGNLSDIIVVFDEKLNFHANISILYLELIFRSTTSCKLGCFFCFFSIWVFFHDHSRITGLQGEGEGISLTPHYHFHPLHRHLDISRAITAESSPLHIASSRTRTWNLWFPSAQGGGEVGEGPQKNISTANVFEKNMAYSQYMDQKCSLKYHHNCWYILMVSDDMIW